MLVAIATEAVELGEVSVGEGIGLEGFEALKIPTGGDQHFEEVEFECTGRTDLGAMTLLEFGEGLFFVVADSETTGEVMPVGILADRGFALGCTGSGGVTAVFAVGGLLRGG